MVNLYNPFATNIFSVLPICTLSPTCRSDIITAFPFSSVTLPDDGKHDPPFSDYTRKSK